MDSRASSHFSGAAGPLYFPVVVISDLHLGMIGIQAEMLYEFLSHVRCDTLIINGDMIDGYRLDRRSGSREFPEMHARVLDVINRRIAEGTKVFYIPGNHDEDLRNSDAMGKTRLGMTFADPLMFTDPAGRRIAVVHGDVFTGKIENGFLKKASLRASDALAIVNKVIDKVAAAVSGRHVAPVARVWAKGNRHFPLCDKFRAAAMDYMKENKADAVFTGHIHVPELTQTVEGIYGNSGDWVDNCTALAMTDDCGWQLVNWLKMRRDLGLGRTPGVRQDNPDEAFRPQTEKQLAAIRYLWPGKNL